ncbi:MAG: hypothetical protein ABR503_06800 [Chitinophagaceae bacterium]
MGKKPETIKANTQQAVWQYGGVTEVQSTFANPIYNLGWTSNAELWFITSTKYFQSAAVMSGRNSNISRIASPERWALTYDNLLKDYTHARMKNLLQKAPLLLSMLLWLVVSCNEKTKDPPSEMINAINIKRGEVVVCGPADNQFGTVAFDVSCSEKAQKDFKLAMALLHSFEYDEATLYTAPD